MSGKTTEHQNSPKSSWLLPSRKLLEQSKAWVFTGFAYGTAVALGVLYFTEFKTVLKYLPYYNLGYATEIQPAPKPPSKQEQEEQVNSENTPEDRSNENDNSSNGNENTSVKNTSYSKKYHKNIH